MPKLAIFYLSMEFVNSVVTPKHWKDQTSRLEVGASQYVTGSFLDFFFFFLNGIFFNLNIAYLQYYIGFKCTTK